jgi:hypothetical protein
MKLELMWDRLAEELQAQDERIQRLEGQYGNGAWESWGRMVRGQTDGLQVHGLYMKSPASRLHESSSCQSANISMDIILSRISS